MKKKRKMIVLALVSLIVLAGCLCTAYVRSAKPNYIDFKYVTEIEVDENLLENESFPWMSIIDEKYHPFFNEGYLKNNYGSQILEHEDFSDKDKCTYIVTFGRKLDSIAYKRSEARTKYLGFIPRQLIGKVSLSDETDNKIYVYKIQKINLVNDMYNGNYYL